MPKDRKEVTCNGRAVLYTALWEDIRNSAMDCGWAVALHGSLASDMDIMAMPWTEDAVSFYELCREIKGLFIGNEFDWDIDYYSKPNKRIVATIPIWADFYLDISTIGG